MNRRVLAIALLIPFCVLTIYAVASVGYVGVFDYQRHSPAGWQVFADLVIALFLVLVWMVVEARRTGRIVWPYVLITLTLGSIGPLLFLALAPAEPKAPSTVAV